MTIEQFTKQNKIVLDVLRIEENPNNPDWSEADHYQVTLRYGELEHYADDRTRHYMHYLNNKKMVTYFSKGIGHRDASGKGKKPTVDEVLDCLASDSSSIENESMDDWIDLMGYSTEGIKAIRKAEKTYKICVEQAQKLKEFLGAEQYNELLWNIERL